MKKTLLYALMLFSSVVFYSCKDSNDGYSTNVEREMMTMFRTQENTGLSDANAYPYYCRMEPDGDKNNQIHLYWFGVKDCAGYEIKMSVQSLVANGTEDWENPDNVLQSWVINDPSKLDMIIKDLDYSTPYRFAIRTLSKKGEEYNSKWYGYGGGQEWEDYTAVDTKQRYPTPNIITFTDRTKTSVRVHLNRKYSEAADEVNHYTDHFSTEGEGDDKHYVMQKMKIQASYDNPKAELPEKWKDYTITDADWANGYIDVDGLEQNCVYIVYVEDENITIPVDANYGKRTVRMRGDKIEPVPIPHQLVASEDTFGIQQAWDARRIDLVLDDYVNNSNMPEGTVFELEGGKNYYFAKHIELVKGMTLRTNPEDIKAGKGRARLFMSGMDFDGTNPRNVQFMFSRNPKPGEDGATPIAIDSLIFEDIDFDSPLSWNYYEAGMRNGTGNYFINMLSGSMAVSMEGFICRNCSFQRAMRGFIRTQGPNEKIFKSMIIEGCEFYNSGMYGSAGADYGWLDDNNKNDPTSTNLFVNVVFRNNTFYNSPRGSMFINHNSVQYDESVHYNVTIENNTFVNFSSVTAGRNIINFQNLPAGGADITIQNNLFIQAKAEGDGRALYLSGANMRGCRDASNNSKCNFVIRNNWSTNENLTNNQIFTTNAFSAPKNSFGHFKDLCSAGAEELDVHVCDISNEELMHSPNPPYVSAAGDGSDQPLMLNTAGLDGENHQPNTFAPNAYFGRKTFPSKASNLYYRDTEKVRNSEIFKLGVGASKWREGIR